jgi:hypothetical protein
MRQSDKITTGANDRPRNETISSTGGGLPDDSSRPVEVDEATVERMRADLQRVPRSSASQTGNPDAVPPDAPGSGENLCRTCAGSGTVDTMPCPDCGGTGTVTTAIGGA